MKQEITQAIATSSVTLATSTGILTSFLGYLGHHAAGIGAACTIIFGIIYVYFQFSSNRKLTIAEINKIEIYENKEFTQNLSEEFKEHKIETSKQFDKVDTKLDKIIAKLV